MATTTKSAETAADDITGALEAQIADLRGELEKLTSGLKERGIDLAEEFVDHAEDFAHGARRNAVAAVETVRHEASAVADVVMEHPISTSALVTTIAGIGFAIGYLLGATTTEKKRFW